MNVKTVPQAKKVRKTPAWKPAPYKLVWVKRDLKKGDADEKFPWNMPPPMSNDHRSPVSLFESFFTQELMEHICRESKRIRCSEGSAKLRLGHR